MLTHDDRRSQKELNAVELAVLTEAILATLGRAFTVLAVAYEEVQPGAFMLLNRTLMQEVSANLLEVERRLPERYRDALATTESELRVIMMQAEVEARSVTQRA